MRGGVLFFVIVFFPYMCFSQYGRGNANSGNFWGISGEVGITSFYGDVDEGPAPGGILKNNTAFKILAVRNFDALVEISGRVSIGKMSGQKIRYTQSQTSSLYFKNNFVEYSFDAGINVMTLFSKYYSGRFGIYGTVGVGLIDIKASLYNAENDSLIKAYGHNGQKATTEFVLPVGLRVIYHFDEHAAMVIQSTLSRVDTDKLDALTGNHNRDYYNFFSMGFIYKFQDKTIGRGIHY